ncbi:MAG: AAA family ATPase, partial [Methanomicrobiales archaeon]|nr:AAA family ATPase [Methanomicrobiales archaeon]
MDPNEENHTIWIEKYRPAKLADMVGQEEIVERLQSYVKSGSMPHLLFTGSAGVGKTTAAVALAKEFFGESWHTNFRELNASDERGIDVVRNQIKQFARTSPL